jgi:NAD+ dependent glucose-6-phosphate dehydrogenase
MTLPKRVLITGAAGNLGVKLTAHLHGKCELVLLDRVAGEGIVTADLAVWDEGWVRHFVGIDAVVHLAGNPVAHHPWPELIGPNIDAVLNVFEASARGGVKRVVFASSNHVMGGYQHDDVALTPQLPPRPGTHYGTEGERRDSTPYASTKLFGERVGQHYAEARGLSVVAVRIGWVWRGENTPANLPADRGPWFRQMWLSDRDYLHLMDCCLSAELPGRFVVVNGMSGNAGMRWDLTDTRRLGYSPRDDVGGGR